MAIAIAKSEGIVMLRGFDVSHWQGSINWAALRDRYGITFGAAKATEGETFTDSEFPANWSKLAAAGLVRMAYHYGHPAKDPDVSVEVFLDYVGAVEATDLLVLDLETGDGLPQDMVNQWARTWAARLTELAGRRPVLYCGRAYQENDTGIGLNGPYSAWWYPRYPDSLANQAVWPQTFNPVLPSPNAWGGPPQWWQFSQSFTSVEGSLDANVFDGTLDDLKRLNMALTPADINLFLDTELTRVTPIKKADGTFDTTITIRDALRYTYDRATKDWALDTAQATALAALPAQIAALADPDEVKAAVAEVVAPLRTLLPGE